MSKLRISDYINELGIRALGERCGNNLRVIKSHLISVCNLSKETNLSYYLDRIKTVLSQPPEEDNKLLLVIDKLVKEFGGKNEL